MITKKIIFTLKGEVVSPSIEIKDYFIEMPKTPLDKVSKEVKIIGDFYIPEKYDGCYIIELPKDKEKLKQLRFTSMFNPYLSDRSYDNMTIKEHSYNPQIDAYYKRFELKGVKFNGNIGTYDYWVCNF